MSSVVDLEDEQIQLQHFGWVEFSDDRNGLQLQYLELDGRINLSTEQVTEF